MDLDEHRKGVVRTGYSRDLTRGVAGLSSSGIRFRQTTRADPQALLLSYCFSVWTSRSTLMAASVRPVGAT
jgi:hypothetical protein